MRTGRPSDVDPNLQNIPLRTTLGRAIRDALVTLVPVLDVDYSQIERRIVR